MMSSPIQPRNFTELLSFFKDQNLCVYPENLMDFIKYTEEEATLQLYVAPNELSSLNSKMVIEIGLEETKLTLSSEFEKVVIPNSIRTKKYYLRIEICFVSEIMAKVLDPSLKFLKEQIDKGNYSNLQTVLLFHRKDVVEKDQEFRMVVSRFTYKEKDYTVFPSKKNEYRIVKIPTRKPGDLHYCSGSVYTLTTQGLKATGFGGW